MILVLDTSALFHHPLVLAMRRANEAGLVPLQFQPVLPAVAYAERKRQLLRDGHDAESLTEIVERCRIVVESFTRDEAERLGERAILDAAWTVHARDFLIAAHVHGNRTAVTADAGPAWEGLARRSPSEATKAVEALLPAPVG